MTSVVDKVSLTGPGSEKVKLSGSKDVSPEVVTATVVLSDGNSNTNATTTTTTATTGSSKAIDTKNSNVTKDEKSMSLHHTTMTTDKKNSTQRQQEHGNSSRVMTTTTTNVDGGSHIQRTDVEEKLRKRLHAKREEDRLREILKRKRDSFRKKDPTTTTGSTTKSDDSHMENDVNMEQKSTNGTNSTIETKLVPDESKGKNNNNNKIEESTGSTNDKKKNTTTDHHHRSKDAATDVDRYDRRSNRPSERQDQHRYRQDRRPSYGPPAPSFRGNGPPSDTRPGPSSSSSTVRSPYNHSFYDSRRPPPPSSSHQSSYPPPYHERGRDGGRRGSLPRAEDDVDPFGRQRRFPGGPDQSNNNGNKALNGAGDQDINRQPRRRSRSPSSNGLHYERKRSRSRSRSLSSSGSSRTASSYSSRSSDDGSSRYSHRSGSHRRKHHQNSSSSSRSSRHSDASSVSRSPSSSHSVMEGNKEIPEDVEEDPIEYSKDQRTVFVTQLVMRTTVRDLAKFFKHHGIKVNDIELLRDRRSGQHKGSAYVELQRMIDVSKALPLSGQAPTFQRFPILIKESEAERNLPPSTVTIAPLSTTTASSSNSGVAGVNPALVASLQQQLQKQAMKIKLPPLKDTNGQLIQAQKVYVGNLEVSVVTTQHLQLLFAPFGTLTEVQLQNGKGFAFLQYYDPKEAALAIQTMAGQVLAGRPMKTGWATNPVISINGVAVVTSNEFPTDAAVRVQNAYQILAQLAQGTVVSPYIRGNVVATQSTMASAAIPTVADARASLAVTNNKNTMVGYPTALTRGAVATVPAGMVTTIVGAAVVDPMKIGNTENQSRHVLVHNMFNKDEETDIGWENDLREEFLEECGKYGTIVNITVVSRETGGKIYTTFSDITGAQTCARSLAGRWFDRRQLRVEYVTDEQVKVIEENYPSTVPTSTN